MKKYNVGIIGYSWAAGAHIDAINDTSYAQVTALCSSRELDSNEISLKHGGTIECYTDLTEMLANPDVQVVSICSYPYDHSWQAVEAANAGKHLIIEKPLALSWEDCLTVEAAVKENGVKACVCFECRFSDQLRSTQAFINKGFLGDIHYAEIDYYHGVGPWYNQFRWNVLKNAGGSSLLSAGCHALDALLMLMDDKVETISSLTASSKNKDFRLYEYPTTSVSIIKFKDGGIGKVASIIDCIQPYYFHIHLVGSAGSLLDNKFYSTRLDGLDKSKWSNLAIKMLDSGDVSDHPYRTQFEAFFRALDQGEDMPLTSLHDAMITHASIFAADHSGDSGKPEAPVR